MIASIPPDDCKPRIIYREHEARSSLTKREQDFAMIARKPPDECKRLHIAPAAPTPPNLPRLRALALL